MINAITESFSIDMTARRGLITDTFKAVKKEKRGDRRGDRDKKPPSPPAAGETTCVRSL